MKTDILIFDVELGQSIFVGPNDNLEYGMLVDCGNTQKFEPIDFLIKSGYILNNTLGNLTLTNYDQDHFSGMPYLRNKVNIHTVGFAPNITSSEIKDLKEKPHTQALEHTCCIKDTYIYPIATYTPPYIKQIFYLQKEHLDSYDTNNLSQVVFIEHNGSVICIPEILKRRDGKHFLKKSQQLKTGLRVQIYLLHHIMAEKTDIIQISFYTVNRNVLLFLIKA